MRLSHDRCTLGLVITKYSPSVARGRSQPSFTALESVGVIWTPESVMRNRNLQIFLFCSMNGYSQQWVQSGKKWKNSLPASCGGGISERTTPQVPMTSSSGSFIGSGFLPNSVVEPQAVMVRQLPLAVFAGKIRPERRWLGITFRDAM